MEILHFDTDTLWNQIRRSS